MKIFLRVHWLRRNPRPKQTFSILVRTGVATGIYSMLRFGGTMLGPAIVLTMREHSDQTLD